MRQGVLRVELGLDLERRGVGVEDAVVASPAVLVADATAVAAAEAAAEAGEAVEAVEAEDWRWGWRCFTT